MFIEYDLKVENDFHEQGIINTAYILRLKIEQHGGGYGKCIQVYYTDYENDGLVLIKDELLLYEVYEAFKFALSGKEFPLGDIGYIRPLFNIPK